MLRRFELRNGVEPMVPVMSDRPATRNLQRGLTLLYEDRDILVVNKPAGLLTMATDSEKTRTAYFILTDYVRKGHSKSRNRILIVHRLDRETSGILIFAKTIEAKLYLQQHWDTAEKKYLAVVHGRMDKETEIISSYLAENKAHLVYSTSDRSKGRLSRTAYRVLKQSKDFALLEIDLLTGRKHQIRVHLAEIGHPVVGDTKYGKENRGHRNLALHARSLSVTHPFRSERLTFETTAPAYFKQLLGGRG
jgi:tRNA pseudouridine32 synthase/23S rRNA pseudouridine746 synthase/23S rRNA pseudouridine1911/1915/1917 synthase